MNPRSLKEILADQLEAKNLTIEQLSSKTDVPEQYVKAIFNHQPERLPALPYIRNYLLTIADFLGIDQDVVLEAYRTEFSAKVSGPSDRLPGNRFAFQKKGRKWLWVAVAGVLVIVLYAIFSSAFFGAPSFRLVNPPEDADIFEVDNTVILLAGTTEPNGKLSINGEVVPVRDDGSFEYEFQLAPELNTIEFKVERFLGKTITIVKKVYVRPQSIEEFSTSTPNTFEAPTTTAPTAGF